TKLFTCATALGEMGPDYRFKTRLVARGAVADRVLNGDLVMIAAGDLALGGRTKPDGTLAYTNSDHTYADADSVTPALTDTDPLAGLADLATQVKKAGIDSIAGDILIDDRLFEHSQGSGSGPRFITPIVVNDNVVDFVLTGSDAGVSVHQR